MKHEFLAKEYELCFDQLRFYDTRFGELMQYLFTIASASVAAQFAALEFTHSPTREFLAFLSAFCLVVFIATLLLYLSMLQNRVYFVYTARQINAIRGFLLREEAPSFTDNQLYTSVEIPAFKARSLHTFHLVGVSLISSLFAGACAYGALRAGGCPLSLPSASVLAGGVLLLEVAGGASYLVSSRGKSADAMVHGSAGTCTPRTEPSAK